MVGRFIILLFTVALFAGCNKNNCEDIVCAPCPEYATYFEVFQFKTDGDFAFLQSDLETIMVEQYRNGQLDYAFNAVDDYYNYQKYLKVLTNENIRIDEWNSIYPIDSIIITIPNLWQAKIDKTNFTDVPTKPSCCGCPNLIFDSIQINNQLFLENELPIHISKP